MTVIPVLAGFVPGVTVTVNSDEPPAVRLDGVASPTPLGGVLPPPPQTLAAVALLRGVGAPDAKSVALLSVSVQPLLPRRTAVVLLGAGVGPAPSKQFAVTPNPAKSMIDAPIGQAPV
ncbi:MAG: hypothetical protein ACREXT_20305, partial [Gammaproteobacteria bacterium]